jgi:hypothetical protein
LRRISTSVASHTDRGFVCGMEGASFDVPGEAEEAEDGDAVPVGIELIPGEAVTGGLGVGVVVVVPAFAEGEEGDPEAVAGGVGGVEATRAPHVGGGVDEPGGVEAEDGAEEDSPEEIRPSAECEKSEAEDGDGQPVPLADPDVELVFAEIGDVGEKIGGVVVHGGAGEEPAHVGPEAAFAGGVRVTCLVGVLVMHAVGGYPEDRTALQGECAADGEEILHPLRSFVTAMGEEAMVAHTDAEASGDPPEKDGDEEGLPMKHEERGDSADVKEDQNGDGKPDYRLREGAIVSESS